VTASSTYEDPIADSILDTVGNTPMIRLGRLAPDLSCTLLAKVELFNPGGSIKDRIALAMIEAAERTGQLRPGGTIIEPTSGNTGAGLAIAAALKGYKVIAVMPDKMSKEKIDMLRAYGAGVVVCPTNVDPDSAESYYSVANRLTAEIPGAFQPDQYSNPANPAAHYASTGPEIWRQTDGRVTHLVAGVGTGGTITGTGRYLKERRPDVEVVGADPVGSIYSSSDVRPYLVEGVGEDFWPTNLDKSVIDRFVTVSDKEAFLAARRLARVEGLLAGGSGGLAVHAALQVAREVTAPDAVVVVVVPDSGRSYLSKVFNDMWMVNHGFLLRTAERKVGEILREKSGVGDVPPLVAIESDRRVRDAVALLHEHQVSQLAVVSSSDRDAIVGSVGERGLLMRTIADPSVLDAAVVGVMDAPFASVSVVDTVRKAVDLLTDDRQALTVLDHGRPQGIVTRSDLLDSLVR
jgi:cystathionine beta-synthase